QRDIVARPALDLRGRGAERNARDRQQRFRLRRCEADGHVCLLRGSQALLCPRLPLAVPPRTVSRLAAGRLACKPLVTAAAHHPRRPWQCLYFLPLPHGHGSLRPTFCPARTNGGGGATATAVSPFPAPADPSASS